MSTAHIEAKKEDIAPIVLMPGDPLRAKYIADNFLENAKLINSVRNMYGYTGFYKGKRVTVFASGMGIASIGIYAYELYKFYDVEKIIRIGTCGTNNKNLKILDIVLAESSYSLNPFPYLFDCDEEKEYFASIELNEKIKQMAANSSIKLNCGKIITSDVFDPYVNYEKYIKKYPNFDSFLANEMESFALFYLAYKLKKEAACLLTVVDSPFDSKKLTSEERQSSLNLMIKLSLDTVTSLNKFN